MKTIMLSHEINPAFVTLGVRIWKYLNRREKMPLSSKYVLNMYVVGKGLLHISNTSISHQDLAIQ